MKDNPTPPEKGASLEQLVELMSENNRATSEIERDGRNTRRHLLEMKKIQQASLDMSDRVNTGFDNFFETMNANKLGDKEKASERASIFEEIRDELKEMRSSGIPQNGGSSGSSAAGGSGGFMKMLGGAGLGVGAAAVGVAAVFASSAYLIKTIEDMDGKKIVQNVDDLLGISKLDADEGAAAEVFGTLAAIGAGLLIFSAGSSAAALSQGVIDKFEGGGWPEKIKANVATLISIADLEGMSVKNVSGVAATMAALGLGLLAFSAGAATGVAVTGVDEAVKHFSDNEGFAKSIKDNVETLLSIDTSRGSGLEIAGTMAALSLGLIAFSIGSVTASAADGASEAIEKFSGGGNWAENIVSNITTLLSIADLSFGDVAKTTGALGVLGTGLAAFGVGSFFAGVGDAASSADSIVSEVDKLLTIGENADKERTLAATGALTSLGLGLTAFAAGKGVNALADIGASIVGFFTGAKSPIEQAIEVGEKADTIQAGADAFSNFADVFERMSSMGEISIEMGSAITDLDDNVRLLETILQGGTLKRGTNFKTDGLVNLGDDVDKAVANYKRIQGILSMDTANGTSASANRDSTGSDLMNISAENVELRTAAMTPKAASNINSVQDNSQVNQGGDTYNVVSQKPNRSREGAASR
jgi:hypothetical protein